jgi:alkylated DNA repair dioxygenase AlkB
VIQSNPVARPDWLADFAPGRLDWRPEALAKSIARAWFAGLMSGVEWRQEKLQLFGQLHTVPRLVAWYGDTDAIYRYSGVSHDPLAWTPLLQEVRAWVARETGYAFNSALLNLYRDGADGMGWHADDEPELGHEPVIASLSLGATRRMRFRRRDQHTDTRALNLSDGSLLVMSGATQHAWQHQISKTRRAVGPRINLTFRQVISARRESTP